MHPHYQHVYRATPRPICYGPELSRAVMRAVPATSRSSLVGAYRRSVPDSITILGSNVPQAWMAHQHADQYQLAL
eukprot:1201156-Rhodomonas_salina.3